MAERIVNIKYILWHLFGGTKGSEMRIKMVKELISRPYNTNQLTELLQVDYNTIKYHLKILADNKLIVSDEKKYGNMFHISQLLEANLDMFNEIWRKSAIKDKKKRGEIN